MGPTVSSTKTSTIPVTLDTLKGYEPKASLNQDVNGIVGPMLGSYITRADADNTYARPGQLTPYVKLTDLNTILGDYAKKTDFNDYAKKTDIPTITGGTITDASYPNKYFYGIAGNFGIGGTVDGINWLNVTWNIVGSYLYVFGQVNLITTSSGSGCSIGMTLPNGIIYNVSKGKATGSFSTLVYYQNTPLHDTGQKLESSAYGNQIGFSFWKGSSWVNAETQLNFSLMFPL